MNTNETKQKDATATGLPRPQASGRVFSSDEEMLHYRTVIAPRLAEYEKRFASLALLPSSRRSGLSELARMMGRTFRVWRQRRKALAEGCRPEPRELGSWYKERQSSLG